MGFKLFAFITFFAFALNSGCALRILDGRGLALNAAQSIAPVGLSYGRSWVSLMNGYAMTALSPTLTYGNNLIYSVSPALPSGLSLDSSTGVISGVPTMNVNPGTDYAISATNSAGTVRAILNIRVLDGFIVNSTLDESDASNDGLCVSTPSGMCTLRAAIEQISNDGVQRVIIVPNGTYKIGSVLSAFVSLAISGQSAASTIISGQNATQMVQFLNGQSYDLADVTIRDANNSAGLDEGGAIHVSQANTQLRVSNANFINNAITGGRGGGAIAVGDWGALGLNLYVEYSQFTGNLASLWHGGGIEAADANIVDLKYVQLTNNTSGQEGGGVFGAANSVTADSVTFSGNSAGIGGGIEFGSTGSATLTNCTFTGNQATGGGGSGLGGAISQLGTAPVSIVNSTIIANTTPNPAGLGGAGIGVNGTGPITLLNTIIAGNQAANGNNNCNAGTFNSSGSNISDNAECSIGTGPGDQANVAFGSLALAPGGLANNGGFVQTMALGAASIAIDTGQSVGCPVTDARGLPRTVCDVGAYEAQ